ncbi:hypothetical protein [Indiicoccus explosivorum]|uniref:hypothetical protein n=1 Tax=Indiicoccus explosivorum TaxID=1917864 RepID=UPI000B44780A|nr:hypothetical protein [Indiicoccus explosivorum]
MARRSGGTFGKLALLGIGALIGSMAAKNKSGTSSSGSGSMNKGDMQQKLQKGLDTLNKQSGGMVDKMKPQISKALDKAKDAIEKQQQTMNQGQSSSGGTGTGSGTSGNTFSSTTGASGTAPTGTPTPGGTPAGTSSTTAAGTDGPGAYRQSGTTFGGDPLTGEPEPAKPGNVKNFEPPKTTEYDSSDKNK